MIQAVVPILAAHGSYRSSTAPWVAEATLSMKVARGCGWSLLDAPEAYLEPLLAHRGWAREVEELVITRPGWVEPASVARSNQWGCQSGTGQARRTSRWLCGGLEHKGSGDGNLQICK